MWYLKNLREKIKRKNRREKERGEKQGQVVDRDGNKEGFVRYPSRFAPFLI